MACEFWLALRRPRAKGKTVILSARKPEQAAKDLPYPRLLRGEPDPSLRSGSQISDENCRAFAPSALRYRRRPRSVMILDYQSPRRRRIPPWLVRRILFIATPLMLLLTVALLWAIQIQQERIN